MVAARPILGGCCANGTKSGANAARGASPPRTEGDKIVRNSTKRNLPLAARPRVGHIGLNGAVAEWLKAPVC